MPLEAVDMGTPNLQYAVLPGCFVHGDPLDPCRIFLPRQNPSETFEYLQDQPMGSWRAMFLCLRHGTVCVRDSDSVQLEVSPMDQGQPSPTFWEIECVCGHENCGTLRTIYAGGMEDSSEIKARILKMAPTIPCGSHNLVWRRDGIILKQIL